MFHGPQESVVIEPPHPFEGGKLDVLDGAPRAPTANDLRLEEPDDGLGQGVVIAVPPAADRRLDTGVGQPLRIANGEVLNPSVVVVDQRLRCLRRSDRGGVALSGHGPSALADDRGGGDEPFFGLSDHERATVAARPPLTCQPTPRSTEENRKAADMLLRRAILIGGATPVAAAPMMTLAQGLATGDVWEEGLEERRPVGVDRGPREQRFYRSRHAMRLARDGCRG